MGGSDRPFDLAQTNDSPRQYPLEKLRTLVAVFGIIFGAIKSIASVLELSALALRAVSAGPGGPWPVVSLRYPAWIISAVASVLLFVGSIAWLGKRRNARVLLTAYAWLSLASVLLSTISEVLFITTIPRPMVGTLANGILMIDLLYNVLVQSIFPLLILVLLKILPAHPRGFEPIMTVSQ